MLSYSSSLQPEPFWVLCGSWAYSDFLLHNLTSSPDSKYAFDIQNILW